MTGYTAFGRHAADNLKAGGIHCKSNVMPPHTLHAMDTVQ